MQFQRLILICGNYKNIQLYFRGTCWWDETICFWQLSAKLALDIQRHFWSACFSNISGSLLLSPLNEATLSQCIVDGFPSALNWWLQIIVWLMYTFLYLNFYCVFKCIHDSIVADRPIFGKGIFFLVFLMSGLLVAITFCMILLFTIYPNWLFFTFQSLLTFWEFLHQIPSFFCLLFYTVFNSLFIFYLYLFMLINTELGL